MHAYALVNKWIAKSLDDSESDWAQIFYKVIEQAKWENMQAHNRNKYTT